MAASAAVAAAQQRDIGGSLVVVAASAAVGATQSVAAAHSATVAARWQQGGGCGGFAGTVRECANAHAFERYRRANVRVFVLGRGRSDNSADGIVVVGSNSSACGYVHRGRQCVAAVGDDAADNNTAAANGDGNADDIVC